MFIKNHYSNGLQKIKKIIDIEKNIKSNIVTKYNESHFHLDRLFVGVTTLNRFQVYTHIYSGFDGLDDAIECCIASSHIPFINGPIVHKYKNVYTYNDKHINFYEETNTFLTSHLSDK